MEEERGRGEEGGRKGVREGGREGGREGERERGRERERERERERMRDRERECFFWGIPLKYLFLLSSQLHENIALLRTPLPSNADS